MRKILLTMAIICCMVVPTFATSEDAELMGSSQVLAKVDNQFTCKIPAEVDLRSGEDTSSVTISYATVDTDKVINVYCMNCVDDSGIVLTNTKNSDKTIYCKVKNIEKNRTATATVPMCTFRSGDIRNMAATKEFQLELDTSIMSSVVGEYSGLLTYGFAIEEE